jgi:serine protease Do
MKRHILLWSDRSFSVLFAMAFGAWCAISGSTETARAAAQEAPTTADRALIDSAIQKAYPTLVRIFCVSEQPSAGRMERQRSAGSGAIISPDGYIVTNHHVAGKATRITCNLVNGDEVEATRVGTDPMADICVIKLKLETRKHPEVPLAVATWGDSDRVKVGDVVLAMGCPQALSQSVTQGIVANTQMIQSSFLGQLEMEGEDVGQLVRWIGHDAIITHGNSGGPLINLQGQIIGINEVGLGSLGGAIPSNLAREVANQLIAHGRVVRSWIGVEFQPRLKGDKNADGALVADVIEGSPAARAGIKAGDIITRFRGQTVSAELLEQIPPINQLVGSTPVGETVEVTFLRDNKQQVAKVTTEEHKPAIGEPQALKAWGITVRTITRQMALEHHRPNTKGALVETVNGGGGAANAKLALQDGDVILKVGGKDVDDVAALKKITTELTKGKTERVPVLVQFERKQEQLLTVVKIGEEEKITKAAKTNKPWSSMDTQVLISDVADKLGLAGRHGVRVTEVFKGQAADKAGVKVGDVITSVDNKRVDVSQPNEGEIFETMIRKLHVGKKAVLKVLRDGKPVELSMVLEAPPVSDEEIKSLTNPVFEFTAHELSYNDRVQRQLPEDLQGVLVKKTEGGGWASLAGIHAGDVLMNINGGATPNIAALKSVLDQIRKSKPRHVVFFVRRGVHTLFCETEPDYK